MEGWPSPRGLHLGPLRAAELQEQRTLRSQLRDMQEHRASAAGYSAAGGGGAVGAARLSLPRPTHECTKPCTLCE